MVSIPDNVTIREYSICDVEQPKDVYIWVAKI